MFAGDRYAGDGRDAACEFLGDSHTAVLATCTSYGDSGVALILTNVSAEGSAEHEDEPVEVLLDVRLAEDES